MNVMNMMIVTIVMNVMMRVSIPDNTCDEVRCM